jgi:hypothetical protein
MYSGMIEGRLLKQLWSTVLNLDSVVRTVEHPHQEDQMESRKRLQIIPLVEPDTLRKISNILQLYNRPFYG